ncbi:spore photoproduct lyase family protein [Sulfurimonas sp. HSL3-7]|uniref:SPL family radical SAM protein n=1 Tax=Sulfonitrofixus jiaomeiensis TaxID=3131938 RepID=UPI0031F94E49
MNAALLHSPCELFSHLYVERAVIDHPQTKRIMARFPRSHIIEIDHYKDVFNRPNQDFRIQSRSKNLILARREAPYLYEGSYYSDGFEFENFFYTPTLLGCLYDCDYCYLQGMYNSANNVLFVNIEAYFEAVKPHLDKPTLVAISYDTDTLATESLSGHSAAWIVFAGREPNLNLEIRTKSANFKPLRSLEPSAQIVLAWTLSPQVIIDRYEHKTPSLRQRLKAIAEALQAGWQVRLCIDPVIYNDDFEALYLPFVDEIFATLDAEKIHQLTLGSFRMSSTYLKRIKKMHSSDIAFYPYEVNDGVASYSKAVEQKILATMVAKVTAYFPKEKIRTWEI